MRTISFALLSLAVVASALAQAPAPAQPAQPSQPEFVRRAQQLVRSGSLEEALGVYETELKTSPNSVAANQGAGVVLDILGRTREAKAYFQRAIEHAATPEAKARARRNLAMSYAFDNDCANTVKYAEMVARHWASVRDYYAQGEALNEAARVCIEAGEFATAEELYRRGAEAGLKEPNITAARTALWKFRTEHALARLAARRNQPEEAKQHVAAARAVLDSNPEMAKDQEIYYPYLTGYVALYTGDPKTALAELKKARAEDPFIQVLMARAYEKLGQSGEARALYEKAASTTAHNPPAAYAKPLATMILKR
jgi:tetratricopeptide (TPR) repeat protein